MCRQPLDSTTAPGGCMCLHVQTCLCVFRYVCIFRIMCVRTYVHIHILTVGHLSLFLTLHLHTLIYFQVLDLGHFILYTVPLPFLYHLFWFSLALLCIFIVWYYILCLPFSLTGLIKLRLSIYISVCPSVRPSVRPSVCLSVSPSVRLSVRPRDSRRRPGAARARRGPRTATAP